MHVLTLHLKACDCTIFNCNFYVLAFLINSKGPHNIMVTALGFSVKWPQGYEYPESKLKALNQSHVIKKRVSKLYLSLHLLDEDNNSSYANRQ